MGFIYKITNEINNKIYIGQTKKTIEERFAAHIQKAKNHTNRYLYDAMNYYGYTREKLLSMNISPSKPLDQKTEDLLDKIYKGL